ncbi:MAG: AAA family ATPase, partial [Acidimicrobiales bacterium]
LGRLGRRLVRRAVTTARADEVPTLPGLLAAHLGPEVGSMPVMSDAFAAYEHVNLQVAIDHWLGAPDRSHQLVGVANFQHNMFTLADLAQAEAHGPRDHYGPRPGAVAMARLASGPAGATLACVRCGLYLVDDVPGADGGASRLAILLRQSAPQHGEEQSSVEIVCADPERGAAVLGEIRDLAMELSVFRGQVLSFEVEMFGPRKAPIAFHERPSLDRSALVLPPGVLEAVEAQVMGVARHRERLAASGQHLKRGLLLHGAPGTGKTHTIRYLESRLTSATVVVLSGNALRLIAQAVSIARALQPALVVVEDVDLIAEERGMHPGQHPLLFQLLNEMDGLGEDMDVTFLLTTNRADLLEPALAQRPGRVDQAVELPLPDADGRLRLLQLYRRNLTLEVDDPGPVVAATEGMTASFLKELLRRAALVSAERDEGGAGDGAGGGAGGDGPLTVTDSDLRDALDQLLGERNRLTRVLLGSGGPEPEPPPPPPTDGRM